MRAFFAQRRWANQHFISYTMDLLSVPEYVIKKRRPHGHRCGKKSGDREHFTANQLKKRFKKKYFPGVHDWFKRDPEFRNRMIENHRDEELCRRCYTLSDEYHTHHLTSQEYFLYQSEWRLHSNKQGSKCMPVTHRLDFKQALSTLQRLKQETEGDPQVPTYSHRYQQWAQSSSSTWWIGKVHGGLLVLMEVTMERHQVLTERGDLLNPIFERFFWIRLPWTQLLCYRWIVYSWPRSTVTDGGGANTTPRMTHFRGAKVCNKWLQERIDDHIIQSDHKYTNVLKVRIQQLLRGDDAR